MELIVTADWHLRADKPRCRIDEDWYETQRLILRNLVEIVRNQFAGCCVVVGDIFHRPNEYKMAKLVQDFAYDLFSIPFIYLYGNHDCFYHNLDAASKSAVGLLQQSFNCELATKKFDNRKYKAFNFGSEPKEAEVMFLHTLTFPDEESKPPMAEGVTAQELLDKYPKAQWIFTGDYHRNFHYENNGRHVINPGCLTRQVADMKDYDCGVYYVDLLHNRVKFISVGDTGNLVDDSYLIENVSRETRIDNFVNKLKDTQNISLDFIANVENTLLNNDLKEELKGVIRELIE